LDLFHYHLKSGNFGDDLNLWLWDEILPGWREALPGHLLVGVGTLINNKLPRGVPKVVLGSGVGYGDLPDAALQAECRFVAVRGPRSAAALGLPAETGIVDPAVLIADLPAFQNIAKSSRPVFVPHHASVRRADWPSICARAGVDYVSPEGDAAEVIRKLAAAPLVIAESMHAVILADAFGTPWIGVSISHLFHASKWQDWAESLGVTLKIQPMFPLMETIAHWLPKRAPKNSASTQAGPKAPAITPPMTQGAARRKLPLRLRIRILLERRMAVARLRVLARAPGQLSDRARLTDAKARYLAALTAAFADKNGASS
jgi:succinoglycan biosynthesis protein ExoV